MPLGRRIRASRSALGLTASALAISLAAALPAMAAGASDTPVTTAPKGTEVQEVVVNGIPYHETVLPTRLSSSSVYGLKLNVMDTPRNTTLLSTTQLQTLNVQDPRAFSYLTASSYTDSAFGTPNIPRIRGQYADVFINGMRSSFTDNGYGAPPNFDSLENISITKGPASVVDGPGPGVGGEVDFLTKRPNMFHMTADIAATFDSVYNNRLTVDVGGPIIPGDLAARISYSGDDSGSYFYGHYMHKNAVYLAVRWRPTDNYSVDFNTELNSQQYTENVGLNRVNQALIDHEQYLQGQPVGEYNSTFFGFPDFPIQIGSPGNPYSPVAPFLTEISLTNSVPIDTRKTIDQAPGTSSRSLVYNAQLIQTYNFNNDLVLTNNTFFDYQNSDNQEGYYFADSSNGSYTIENRTDLNDTFDLNFGSHTIKNDTVGGLSVRFAHTNYIDNFSAETPAAYDLTANPALFVTDIPTQEEDADAFLYKSAFGRTQLGTPGRDGTNAGNTGISDLIDVGLFFQNRMEFSPQWSVLYGGRVDAVKNHTYDPLGGPICADCFTNLPQSHTTGVFGLLNGNVSVVYRPAEWISGYVTFNFTQSNDPNGGEGGINTYGTAPDPFTPGKIDGTSDSALLRQPSYLYEAGLKFNLLNNKLFAGTAIFDQKRVVPTGPGGTGTDQANIRGVEIELNYQPTRNLFATASYSYIKTTLADAPSFYNYPSTPGNNYPNLLPAQPVPATGPISLIDGAGAEAVFQSGQTFKDPGVPEHIFNFLGNYKSNSGLGMRFGVQVTGPIDTTVSGKLLLGPGSSSNGIAATGYSSLVPQYIIDNGGYYKSPTIPWQYTLNTAVFYEWGKYTATFSIYNLTDQINWQSSPSFYGNDFLVRNDPRTYELRLEAKF